MGTIGDTKKTTQQIAQQIAKQMAQEPLEILKDAGKQVSGMEKNVNPGEENKSPQPKEEIQLKQKIEAQGQRQMQALKTELQEIENQNLFSDLLKRISEGEIIPLEEYPQLSEEQKESLRVQMEAIKVQKEQAVNQKPLIEPASKPSRNLFGQKAAAEKQQTHVEKPLPPSG